MRFLLLSFFLLQVTSERLAYSVIKDKVAKHPAEVPPRSGHSRQPATPAFATVPPHHPPPRLPKGQYLQVKSQASTAPRIVPTVNVAHANAAEKSYFDVVGLGNGKAKVKFIAKDPDLYLDDNASIIIHFPPQHPFTVTPNLLTRKEWKPRTLESAIHFSGGIPGHGGKIYGKASYAVCSRKTRKCRYILNKIESFIQT